MELKQFRYSKDNLGYLLFTRGSAMAVDGGAPQVMLDFLSSRGLELRFVTNTHSHGDHTCGNHILRENTDAAFIGLDELGDMNSIDLGDEKIRVIHTPGHTADSVCFLAGSILLSGDTLFNGKVGRCFTGDAEGFFRSVSRLSGLPGDTLVYAGHDYVQEYLAWVRDLTPDNPFIDDYLDRYDPGMVVYCLEDERRVDPFLRLDSPEVAAILDARGLPHDTEIQRWKSLLTLM